MGVKHRLCLLPSAAPWGRKAQPLERVCMLQWPFHRLPARRNGGLVRSCHEPCICTGMGANNPANN